MLKKTDDITGLIHENLWNVISFAVCATGDHALVEKRFLGEWKYLNKTIYDPFGEREAGR